MLTKAKYGDLELGLADLETGATGTARRPNVPKESKGPFGSGASGRLFDGGRVAVTLDGLVPEQRVVDGVIRRQSELIVGQCHLVTARSHQTRLHSEL